MSYRVPHGESLFLPLLSSSTKLDLIFLGLGIARIGDQS